MWKVILCMEIFMLKLVWRLSGVFMEKTWQLKLQTISILILSQNLDKKYHSLYCLHLIYRVSHKCVPCVNKNNSGNIYSNGKIKKYFENLRHLLTFCIYLGPNKVSFIRARSAEKEYVFQHFSTYFCIHPPFHNIFLCWKSKRIVCQVEIKMLIQRILKHCLLNILDECFRPYGGKYK